MNKHAFAMAALLLGCDSSGGPAPAPSAAAKSVATPASVSAAPGAPKCAPAEDLRRTIAGIGDATRVAVDAQLPEGQGGEVPQDGIVVELAGGKTSLDGADTPPLELVDRLKQRMELRSGASVLVAVAKDEDNLGPIPRIAEAVGETPLYVIATTKGSTRIATPESIAKEMVGKDRSDRARLLAEAISKEIDDCKPAEEVFQRLATIEPSTRSAVLAKDLPAAIEKCGCKVDAALVGLVGYALGGDTIVVGKKLTVSKDPKATAIALKDLDGTKWYEAVPSDGSPVRLSP